LVTEGVPAMSRGRDRWSSGGRGCCAWPAPCSPAGAALLAALGPLRSGSEGGRTGSSAAHAPVGAEIVALVVLALTLLVASWPAHRRQPPARCCSWAQPPPRPTSRPGSSSTSPTRPWRGGATRTGSHSVCWCWGSPWSSGDRRQGHRPRGAVLDRRRPHQPAELTLLPRRADSSGACVPARVGPRSPRSSLHDPVSAPGLGSVACRGANGTPIRDLGPHRRGAAVRRIEVSSPTPAWSPR
jgi:hypothetical protein